MPLKLHIQSLHIDKSRVDRKQEEVTLNGWRLCCSDQTGIDREKAKAREAETELASKLWTDMEGEEARDTEIRASGSIGEEWSGASADEWEVWQAR